MLLLPAAALRCPLPTNCGDDGSHLVTRASKTPGSKPSQTTPGSKPRPTYVLEHSSSACLNDLYDVDVQACGNGGFGSVRRARLRDADKLVRAVKSVKKRDLQVLSMVSREISILKQLDHPHICRLFETFEDFERVHLVMEYVEGQELFDYIQNATDVGRSDEAVSRMITKQIFSALHYCHSHHVVHRDLKPENIMVVERVYSGEIDVKLIDFGLAKILRTEEGHCGIKRANSFVGTQDYIAPEVRNGQETDFAADIWSIGMVLHALLLGGLPCEEIRFGEEPLDVNKPGYDTISAPAQDLLKGLLCVDPEHRLTAEAAMRSEWVTLQTLASRSDSFSSSTSTSTTLRQLVAFPKVNKLRRALLNSVAHHISSENLAGLRDLFMAIDGNGDGCITKDEFVEYMTSRQSTADDVDAAFKAVDADGSSDIQYTEFCAAAIESSHYCNDDVLRSAFHVFDTDRNGKIHVNEFAQVLSLSAEEIASEIPNYDLNGDGELDYEEFKLLITAPSASDSTVLEVNGVGHPGYKADTTCAASPTSSQTPFALISL